MSVLRPRSLALRRLPRTKNRRRCVRHRWIFGDTFSPAQASYTEDLLRWSAGRWVNSTVPSAGEGSLFAAASIPAAASGWSGLRPAAPVT